MGRELHRISGVDLTRIDGIDVGVAQTVISEVGLDMSRWEDEDHFASWLGLCPDNRITGGKVLRRGTRHVINRAATALRLGASTLLRSQSYLGAQYRRFRGKLGAPKAITAMAHKLACLVSRMLRWGTSTWIRACNTTRRDTANNKSTCSRRRPPSSGFNSSSRKSPELLRDGFWRA